MAATPKNPTNGDLYRKLDSMDTRIATLEQWKIAEDAAKAAVSNYRRQELQSKRDKSKMEVFQALLPFIIALTALVYGIITYMARLK